MELLYVTSGYLFCNLNGATYGLPSCSDNFFQKYLDVFNSIRVTGEPLPEYLNKSALVPIRDSRISVRILPPNIRPNELKNDGIVKKILKEEISKADAILIKPTGRKGLMAIKIAKMYKKPYMLEFTGDIHNALNQSESIVKRLYSPVLYRSILRNIKDAPFGLYVSESYLQKQFPISGKMCGCSDVVLRDFSPKILERRIHKIITMKNGQRVDLALIGFYQGKMKGVDTAIRALSQLPENVHLNILGNGTEENRKKWIAYGNERGVYERIHFPNPLPSSDDVMMWLDDMDFFVFPTRSEGLPRCVAEAIARACPVFATNICTLPELLSEDCLFPLDDDRSLASLISGCLEDSSRMIKIAEENFEHARNYEFTMLKNKRNSFLMEFRNFCEHKNQVIER